MENKRAGDLHGAFEIISPLSQVNAQLKRELMIAVGFSLAALIVVGTLGALTINLVIIAPLTDLALKLQDIAGGEGNLRARLNASGKSEFAWVARQFQQFRQKDSQNG